MQNVRAALAGWRQSSRDKRPLIPGDKKSETHPLSHSQPRNEPFSDPSQSGFRFRTADIEGPSAGLFGLDLSNFSNFNFSNFSSFSDFSNIRYFNASDFRSLLRDNASTLAYAALALVFLLGLLGLLLGLGNSAPTAGTPTSAAATDPIASCTCYYSAGQCSAGQCSSVQCSSWASFWV